MNDVHTRWHLLGAGALGCLFAFYLRRAGVALELILRGDAAHAQFKKNGGIILTRGGKDETIAVPATTAAAIDRPITRLLICTKAQQTLDAVTAIGQKISPTAQLVLLQNGMGVREQLQSILPRTTILHALSTEGAFRTAPFRVTHAGSGETLIGTVEPSQQILAERAAQSLRCELPIASVTDIDRRLWLKLAVNSVINPLTALHRCRNGELSQLPHIDRAIDSLCDELARLAQAEHIAVSAAQMRDEIHRVMGVTAQNKSSMLQDVEAGRSTEIDFINGFIVRRARAHDLRCPHHEHLLDAVRALQP